MIKILDSASSVQCRQGRVVREAGAKGPWNRKGD